MADLSDMLDMAQILRNNVVTLKKKVADILDVSEGDYIGYFEHPEGILIKKLNIEVFGDER